ncbi:MAG: 50S ribosomal protein L21 [Gemmatimonadota bacterium]
MYAIFRAKGKQFRAEPDATLRVPSLEAGPGERVKFDEVLLAVADDGVSVGTPSLAGASISVEVVRHGRDDKIVVFKMKRRKGYRRKQGHRQGFTEVRIVEIDLARGAAAKKKRMKKAAPAAEAPEAGKAPAAKKPAAKKAAPAAPELDITEVARALAEEHGLDLARIEGSGKGGRILKSDVEKAIKAKARSSEAPAADEADEAPAADEGA